jgi:hypothetical protein
MRSSDLSTQKVNKFRQQTTVTKTTKHKTKNIHLNF